jgi:aspartate aminotransferase-like enzyme
MNRDDWSTPVDAPTYAAIEQRLAQLLNAPAMMLLQGEAIVPLEAVARSIGRPGSRALNIVTGPYGDGFGHWLRQQDVEVTDLKVPFNRAVTLAEVEEALSKGSFDVVSIVHAEAATGVVNDLAAIASLARDTGALTVVDAVASVGADPLEIEVWGLDVTVVSAQKALAGPAGVTGVAISDAGWTAMEANPSAPRDSVLSLLDWRERWTKGGRRALPTIPNHLETRALGAALDRVNVEGLEHVIARHAGSRDATRRGVRALGLTPWVENAGDAAAVATTVAVPHGVTTDAVVAAARGASGDGLAPALTAAPGPLASQALRVSHTGARATIGDVLSTVAALGIGLRALGVPCDLDTALSAVLEA